MIGLDRYERRILAELQADGRLTNQELAERVGLSPSACWRRVKSLEEAGIIRGYTALLDPRKIGMGECVFAHITLEKHSEGMADRFIAAVRKRPEVLECYATTGDADFLLRVVISQVSDYDRFLQDFIFKLEGIAHVRSHFALREIKYDTRLPIPLDGPGPK